MARIGHGVALEHVTQRFGSTTAVDDVHLDIKAGEFFSFLGPSGCGKTTILRLICGFMEPTAGRILIGGEDMRGVGANRRPTVMIFQNLALFPLMTVADNIGFGLEVRGVDKATRAKRVGELLDLIALPGFGDKPVAALSGGQKQRVAIARALAVEPTVLLLDEPLSALDLKLRQHMRAELRAIHERTGVTFIYITHDQGEALTMSDRVAVMSNGRLEQVATPQDIYDDPATAFVAGFVGEANRIPGKVVAVNGNTATLDTAAGRIDARNRAAVGVGETAEVFVRPERMRAGSDGIAAKIVERAFEGPFVHVTGEAAGGLRLTAQVTNTGTLPPLDPGKEVRFAFAPTDAVVLKAGRNNA